MVAAHKTLSYFPIGEINLVIDVNWYKNFE